MDNGCLVIAAAIPAHLFLASLWTPLSPYFISYLSKSYTLSESDLFFVPALSLILMAISTSVDRQLLRFLHPKLILTLGGLLILTGYLLASLTSNPYLFIFLYTGLPSIGSGICYLIPIICAWEYYPNRKGLITGLILSAASICPFAFSFFFNYFFNPTNI